MKKKLLSLAVASLVCGSVAEARFYIGVEGGYVGAPWVSDPTQLDSSNEVKFSTTSSSAIKNAFKTQKVIEETSTSEIEPYEGYSVGINFGSEHLFLRDYLGVRWGASVGYTDLNLKMSSKGNNPQDWAKVEANHSFLDVGLSLDLMTNFYSSQSFAIGVFGGAELGYHYMLTGKYEDKKYNETLDMKKLVPSRHSLDLSGRVGITTLIASHHRIDLTAKLPIGSVVAGKASNVKIAESIARTTLSAGYKFVF